MKKVSWSWAGVVIAPGSSASAREPLYAPLPGAASVFQDSEQAPPPVPILSPAREVETEPVYDDGLCRPSKCLPWWAHNHNVHADWLFLSAREQDLDYATRVDGTTNTAVPVGQTAMLSPGYQSGWRIGGALAIDNCSSLFFDWTSFSSSTRSETLLDGGAPQPNSFLRSELVHPRTLSGCCRQPECRGCLRRGFRNGRRGLHSHNYGRLERKAQWKPGISLWRAVPGSHGSAADSW